MEKVTSYQGGITEASYKAGLKLGNFVRDPNAYETRITYRCY
jgi:hypothetical protein